MDTHLRSDGRLGRHLPGGHGSWGKETHTLPLVQALRSNARHAPVDCEIPLARPPAGRWHCARDTRIRPRPYARRP